MNPRRILIVNVRSLLMEIVVRLLESNGNSKFHVVTTITDNLPDLIQEIKALKPGVIVLDEDTSLFKPADLVFALVYLQNIRLIALNSRTSKMDIYDKSESVVTHPGHFIEALNNETLPPS